MKLVEILAKELSEWKEDAYIAMQDNDSDKTIWFLEKDHEFVAHDGFEWKCDSYFKIMISRPSCLATDYKDAIVTKAQWQAERDRQKGGEWKRHRGGKQPVENRVRVEYKLRCGETGQCASEDLMWDHQKDESDVMQYRVISQPQAEDGLELVQGAQDAVISCIAHNFEVGKITHGPIMIGDEIVGEASPEWNQRAKWDQIDGPLRWRDEVTELNAYIEKYTRERDALIERLASEGFALIPAMTPVMGVAEISIPYPEWEIGDIIEVVSTDGFCNSSVRVGDQYPISHKDSVDVKGPTGTFGDEDNYKFIRRP